MLYAGTVAHVAQDVVRESPLKHVGAIEETAVLLGRELVEPVAVATHEVREHGTWHECRLAFESLYQGRHVLHGVEAQAVHASVQFYVYGHAGDASTLGSMDESIEEAETVHLGLQVVLEEGVETGHLGVHDHDVLRYAVGTEQGTLVGHRHGQIAHLLLALQGLCHLHGTSAIGIGLDHADDASLRLEEGAVVVEILHHGTQVDLQYGFVHLLLQSLGDGVEVERACTLDEHQAVAQVLKLGALHERLGGGIEGAPRGHTGKAVRLAHQFPAYANEHLHATFFHQACHMRIQLG